MVGARLCAALVGALVLSTGAAHAQAHPEVQWATGVLARWAETAPAQSPPMLLKIHGLAIDARARAKSGESPLPERLELLRLHQRNVNLLRDLLQARRKYMPVGTAAERVSQLKFTLGVSAEGLIDILGVPVDKAFDRIRAIAPRWVKRLHDFVEAVQKKDFDTVDSEFDMLSRPIGALYDEELAKEWGPSSAGPMVAPSATPSAPASARPADAPGDPAADARKRFRRLSGLAVLAALGAFGLGLLSRRFRATPTDLTAPLGLLAAGKPDAALPQLQAALARRPADQHEVRAHVIRCMVRMGQIELAMKALPELALAQVSPRALYLLARDLEERAQTKAALEIYARVYLIDADLEDTRERYERLRSSSGLSAAILTVDDLAARLPARYSKAELLGHGGMGVVLKALDSESGQTVALKVIAPAVASDPAFVKRFRREVRALTVLEHPAIIRILDSQIAPFPYYAMEFFEGVTISRLLATGPLTEARAARIAGQVASGLARTHELGIVHRDIKPDNVLVGPGDRVKVLDFGLARLAGGTVLTRTGLTSGSAPYMAPEQLRGDECGAATDVYALGLVLYLLVTGRAAFGTADPAMRLVKSPERLATTSAAFADLVEACLQLTPEKRPKTAEIAERLTALGAAPARGGIPA